MSLTWDGTGRPLIIAHRGDQSGGPENSVAAIEGAREAQADGVELDVRLTRDGVPVIFHDNNLLRMTGSVGEVSELTAGAIARRTLFALDPDAPVQEARIPNLDQVVRACGDDLLLNLELKVDDPRDLRGCLRLVDACAEVLRDNPLGERLLLSSFHPVVLVALKRALPGARLAYLFHGDQALPLRRGVAALGLFPRIVIHPERRLISHRFVARWRAVGARIHVWTVDDPREMTLMLSLGLDAIITNRPRLLYKVLEWGPRGWQIAEGLRPCDGQPIPDSA